MEYASLLPHFVLWIFVWLAERWSEASPYLVQLLLGGVAFLGLLKDWKDYGALSARFGKKVPLAAAVLILAITYLGLQNTYHDTTAAKTAQQKAQDDQKSNQQIINQLAAQLQQLRQDNQLANTTFSDSFAKLYARFSDLQSKVQNTELLKEIKETKQELADTQKKLAQPKATLVGTFPVKQASEVPITEETLQRVNDVVNVQFTVYDSSDVNAVNGSVIVRVCQLCKFAEEPAGFRKVAGAEDYDREFAFQHIYARGAIATFSVKVRVPVTISRFGFSVIAACDTCAVGAQQDLWINVK